MLLYVSLPPGHEFSGLPLESSPIFRPANLEIKQRHGCLLKVRELKASPPKLAMVYAVVLKNAPNRKWLSLFATKICLAGDPLSQNCNTANNYSRVL
jgi:hypothetical protein